MDYILQFFYFHYIIGRPSLALSDPCVDLCLEIRISDELFILETMISASRTTVEKGLTGRC